MTIFQKIIDKEVPARIVYEDDLCLAFHDIQPQAPIHILLIPKRRIPSLADLDEGKDKELLGHLMIKQKEIADSLGLSTNGYRLVANTKEDAGQTVDHLHFHILGGRSLSWPPG